MLTAMTRVEQESESFGRMVHGAYVSCGRVKETFAQDARVSHELIHEVVHGRAHLLPTESLVAISRGLEAMGIDSEELLLHCLLAKRFSITPESELIIQLRIQEIVQTRRMTKEYLIERIRRLKSAGFTHSELLLVHRAILHARPAKMIPRRRRQVSFN